MKRIKKVLSFTLCLVMLLCFLPSSVLAQIGEALNSEENEALTDLPASDGNYAPYVLGEVEDRRTETSKTFRMSDGSYIVADYGKRIHFEDENGNLQDYDNTLSVSEIMTLDADDFVGAVNAESDVFIKLANNSNSNNLLKLQKDNYKISLHLVGADKSKALEIHTPEAEPNGNDIDSATTLHKFSSGAVYRDIVSGVDLEYLIYGNTVKENIIVKEQLDSYVFTFELNLNGLTPTLQPDGSIALNSATSAETVMIIPKGIMYDANGNSSNAVEYAISHKNGNKYSLSVTADEEWINAEERAFPVTVDPTITGFENGADTVDAPIFEYTPSYNGYLDHRVYAGHESDYERRTLIMAESLPELPNSAVIVNASLYMLQEYVVNGGATVCAYRINESWHSSTVTWANCPEYDTEVIDYNTLTESNDLTTIKWDVTRIAQQWYSGVANYGIMLAAHSNSAGGYVRFYSSDSSQKPILQITYLDTKGIEGMWTYSSQGAGNAGVGYVNGLNGNLVFIHGDLTTKGNILPISVSHVYNSYLAGLNFDPDENNINAPITSQYSNSLMGYGWKLNAQETLVETTIDGTPYFVYNDGDGTEHYYFLDATQNKYIDESGSGWELTIGSDGSEKYIISDELGNKKYFNSNGYVRKITDVHGNKKEYEYNPWGQLYRITSTPVGQTKETQINFTYNGTGENASLLSITDGYDSDKSVRYYYSLSPIGTDLSATYGYLRKIEYFNDGQSLGYSTYEYDYNGLLICATDSANGYKLTYTYSLYNGNYRVSAVTEAVGTTIGQKVGFSYGDKLFTVRTSGNDDVYGNADDLCTHTLFSDLGVATCSYSTKYNEYNALGASYAEYYTNLPGKETNYKVKTSAVKGITNNNLLYNPNCEPSSAWTKVADGSGYSASYTTAEKYLGSGALKLSSTEGDIGFAMYSDSVYLTAGTYTFSAYVKLVNVVSEDYGFYLRCINSGECKTGTTNTAIDNGWQRMSHTFTVTSAGYYDLVFSLDRATGTAYVDGAQLEKYDTPSDFNLIENGGFDSVRKWSGSYTLTSGRATLVGSPTAQSRITQTIALNSPVNTTFMLSGWAEASSVSLATSGWDSANGEDPKANRKFGVIAKLTYSDNSTEEFELSFNSDNTNRQYASTAIVPKKTDAALTVTSAEIIVAYDYNANTAYFDDITLTIEPAQTYQYTEEGELKAATDALGNENSMTYATNEVDLEGHTTPVGEEYTYTYRTANGSDTHQVETATKSANNVSQTLTYSYDDFGNVVSNTLTASNRSDRVTSSANYSEDGNYLLSTVNQLGKVTGYNYDNVTKLLSYVENANSIRTAYVYDKHERTERVYLDSDEDGIADTAEAQVAYLYANNRLSGIDTATTDYTLTYDTFGNVLTIKAGNYTLATYEYAGNNGKLKKLTYGNGDYEEYVYDELERLVQTKLNGVIEYTVKYDANGRLYSLTENDSTHIYEYDSLDRLVRAWQEDSNGNITVAVENSYDDLGRAKGSTYVLDDRTMSYEVNYKANSNLVNYVLMPTAGLQSSISYTYDEFERVVKKQNSFSSALNFYEQYGYYNYTDADNVQHTTSLVSTVTFGGNTANAPSVVYSYTYNNLGNITQIRKDGVIINEYTYDSLGQLTCEEDAVAGKTYIYYYDKSGNITQKDGYPFADGATRGDYINYLASQKQTVATYTYGNTSWGDMLTNYNGTAITYDAIGNPTKWRNAVGLTWEARELQRTDLATGAYVDYTYNSDGIRTSRSYLYSGAHYSENRKYILDGTKIIQEDITISTITALTNATLYYLYDVSGEVQGFIYNNSYYYFQKNLQGDVVRILNSSGSVVTEYTYDVWGKVLTTTGSMASTVGKYNPFRYRSYYYDTETGFYYLQSRYYDPTVGRFLNADGVIGANGGLQGYNMFAYCNNNPISFADYIGYDLTPVIPCTPYEKVPYVVLTREAYYNKIPEFAHDWISPVYHGEYHNNAPCAAFGYYRSGGRTHKGVDYYPYDSGNYNYGGDGTPQYVYAMASGVVDEITSNYYKGSGSVKIIQDDGYYVIYGEIEAIDLVVGQRVEQGQLIGIMERSTSNTLMLHLQIHEGSKDGELVDPTFTYSLLDGDDTFNELIIPNMANNSFVIGSKRG